MAKIVCEKGLRINCRIGNAFLKKFEEKYCRKILNRKLLLELVCGKVLRKTCRIGNAILKKFAEKYCGN